MKIVINDSKTGNSFQRELDAAKVSQFIGKKIGDSLEGSLVGLPGYELKITGGSDTDGTPMRFDISGARRVYAVISGGAGTAHLKRGQKLKKRVAGNTVSNKTAQLNVKITKHGEKPLAELGFVPKPREKKPEEKS